MATLSPILTIMIRAAEKAGRVLVRDFGEVEQLQVSRKGPADFVTAADKRSEEIIFEELQKAKPDFSFLMEEGGDVKGKDPDNVWIIDPIDGTHNFMHGIPHWCISIALQNKDKIVSGVIYDPVKDELFYAEKGTGAFLRGHKRLRASGRNQLESCVVSTGYTGMDPARRADFTQTLDELLTVAPMMRRMGSAALDLAYVAAGRFDAFYERNIKPWDVAAGILLVRESGGMVSSIDNGEDPVYSGNIIAANNQIHGDLHKLLKSAKKKAA